MKSLVIDDRFKILQITDIHIGNSFLCRSTDRKALAAVEQLVARTEPDLIAVTGDICYAVPYRTATVDNMTPLKQFVSVMESTGIPWAPVFGNHDAESFSTHSKEQLGEYLQAQSHCLFEAGDVSGCGNYAVGLNTSDGTERAVLLFLDSGGYKENKKGFFGLYATYDVFREDQIDWCRRTLLSRLTEGRIPPSLAFFHIPLWEYEDAWKSVVQGGSEVVLHYGEKNERAAVGFERSSIFEELRKLGTKGLFCGHDHTNTYSVTYRGVRLTYGMSIDYFAYPFIGLRNRQRGGTLITVCEDGTFDCEQISLPPRTVHKSFCGTAGGSKNGTACKNPLQTFRKQVK